MGNLVRPADLYLPPDEWWQKSRGAAGRRSRASRHHSQRRRSDAAVTFLTQPTPRFHGSVPAMLEEVQKLTRKGKQRDVRGAEHWRSRATGRHLHRIQRFVPPGQPHARRRELCRRDQPISPAKCWPPRWSRLTFRMACSSRMRISQSLARAICSTSRSWWRRGRSGRSRRSRRSFRTSATCRLATTWCTWNTASGSTRD